MSHDVPRRGSARDDGLAAACVPWSYALWRLAARRDPRLFFCLLCGAMGQRAPLDPLCPRCGCTTLDLDVAATSSSSEEIHDDGH